MKPLLTLPLEPSAAHRPGREGWRQLSASQHQVTLITRVGCHLCADAEAVLRSLRGELGFGYEELDVDADPALRAEYSDRVPVILLDGAEHGYWRVEEPRLRAALAR